jgi:hypothetical protein
MFSSVISAGTVRSFHFTTADHHRLLSQSTARQNRHHPRQTHTTQGTLLCASDPPLPIAVRLTGLFVGVLCVPMGMDGLMATPADSPLTVVDVEN